MIVTGLNRTRPFPYNCMSIRDLPRVAALLTTRDVPEDGSPMKTLGRTVLLATVPLILSLFGCPPAAPPAEGDPLDATLDSVATDDHTPADNPDTLDEPA